MKTISRYIMTLALLITAVTGARAAWTGGTYTATANENLGAITVNGDATLTINSDVTVTVTGGINIASGTLTVTGPGTLVVTGAKGNNGASGWNGGNGGNGGVAISGNIIVQGGATVTANGGSAGSGGNGELEGGKGGNGGNAFAGTLTYKSGTVTACGGSAGSGGWGDEECASSGSAGKAFANDVDFTQTTGYSVTNGTSTIGSVLNQPMVVISGGTPAGPEVTINDDKTEASFEMPTYDLTVDYELVRDMSYKVAFSGVPTRARLAKDGDGKFHFADGLTFQLLDNIDANNPKDITSAEGITFMVGEVDAVDIEGSTYYQLNKETLVPLADFLADAHLGNYAICAVASTGEYDGSFTSGTITLFQGYEVQVAAKEFITYYKDEPLYVEDEDAELYTIQSVSGDQAVLSDKSDAMPSNTPMLVYNKSNETKVILLIPCAEPDMAITVAPEFQGTLTGTTIAASTDAQTNYAFNGKAFVFVKDAIEVGPNKAWLEIGSGAAGARSVVLVFSDSLTGVNLTPALSEGEGAWYDLSGRKLQGKPTKSGVYINNGKKVTIK